MLNVIENLRLSPGKKDLLFQENILDTLLGIHSEYKGESSPVTGVGRKTSLQTKVVW